MLPTRAYEATIALARSRAIVVMGFGGGASLPESLASSAMMRASSSFSRSA